MWLLLPEGAPLSSIMLRNAGSKLSSWLPAITILCLWGSWNYLVKTGMMASAPCSPCSARCWTPSPRTRSHTWWSPRRGWRRPRGGCSAWGGRSGSGCPTCKQISAKKKLNWIKLFWNFKIFPPLYWHWNLYLLFTNIILIAACKSDNFDTFLSETTKKCKF